jgi:hypothetical protein
MKDYDDIWSPKVHTLFMKTTHMNRCLRSTAATMSAIKFGILKRINWMGNLCANLPCLSLVCKRTFREIWDYHFDMISVRLTQRWPTSMLPTPQILQDAPQDVQSHHLSSHGQNRIGHYRIWIEQTGLMARVRSAISTFSPALTRGYLL